MSSRSLAIVVFLAMLAGTLVALPARAVTPVSPLLWGENLGLYRNTLTSDPFLTNASLRGGLKAAHTQIIRMPVRGPSDNPADPGWGNEPEFEQAAQYVKQLGLAPLVILRAGPPTAQAVDVDLDVVDYMTDLFAGQAVYYEFGNEPDLDGAGFIPVADYVAKWNTVIPDLEDAAGPSARFVGPVSYQYDETYLRTFLQGVDDDARPDMISWHTYTCETSEPPEDCLNQNGIEAWPARFASARTLMSASLGEVLPIWITEWNFNPHDDLASDPKLQNQQFIRDWTLKALTTGTTPPPAGVRYSFEDGTHATTRTPGTRPTTSPSPAVPGSVWPSHQPDTPAPPSRSACSSGKHRSTPAQPSTSTR